MNPINFQDLVSKEENESLSFVERVEDPHHLCEQMVAIANSNGGYVIIGVKKDGTPSGLTEDDIVGTMRMITQVSFEYVQPSIFPKTRIVDYKGSKAIVVQIPLGLQKPYCTVRGTFLIKTNSNSIDNIDHDDLRELFQEKMVNKADQIIIEGLDHNNIDIDLFKKYFKKKYKIDLPKHIPLMTILESMKLASNGQVNITGMLLFGLYPNEQFSLSQVVAMAFYGNDTSMLEYRDSDNFEGTIPDLLEKAIDFIQRNLKASSEEDSSLLEIPEKIITEVLVNALVHRSYYLDYFTSGNIVISVFDNRVEIESPGMLSETLTIESIKNGTAFQRNSNLSNHIIDLIPFRGIGLGVSAILSEYPGIELIDDEDSEQFKVIIKRPE